MNENDHFDVSHQASLNLCFCPAERVRKEAGPSNLKRLPDKPGRLNEPANRLHYAESDAVTLFRPLHFAS